MRKRVCYAVVLLMIVGQCLSPLSAIAAAESAAPAVSLEQAMTIAKERLAIPENYKLIMSYYARYSSATTATWALHYSDGIDGSDNSIVVEIDGISGEVVKANWGFPRVEDPTGPQTYSSAESQAIAQKFMGRVLKPADLEQLYLVGNKPTDREIYYDPMPTFHYSRILNGYPFLDDGVDVGVDRRSGKVVSYSRTWTNETCPSTGEFISLQDAAGKFFDVVGLELGYVKTPYYVGNERREQLIPAYYPRISNVFINGGTGEIVNEYGSKINPVGKQEYEPLCAPPVEPIPKQGVTPDQAMTVCKNAAKVPSDYILVSSGLMDEQWFFNWQDKNDERKEISASINQKTGEITQLYHPSPQQAAPAAGGLSRIEAKEKAVAFIKQLLPNRAHLYGIPKYDYLWVSDDNNQNALLYQFYFPRLVNQLPFREKGINITVKNDGTLISYEARLENYEFPAPQGLIPEQEAQAIFERNFISNLTYTTIRPGGKSQVILAYRAGRGFGEPYYIDARTGLINSMDGVSYDEGIILDSTKAHWAGKDIARLVSMRVIDPKDGLFFPNLPVTRAEMVKMLVKAIMLNRCFPSQPSFKDVTKENMYLGYIEAALKAGIVQGSAGSFRPDSFLTREEMAVIISKIKQPAAGANPLPAGFKDTARISPWAKDSVEITQKLGLMRGDPNGNFNPKKNVTNGETAALLNRLIEKMN